ncbi:uncharacterized protein FSUBG_10577 [Fusarium subglutinans]|uniref:Apple domain-containing protein n=1 Tax=Gibberella subglutinans TaxID=42677 RepID=A0A8H5P6X8_GIBSU|nr:uncharacterized protein FSUBG_10577 [Fusarium subglutinans]KAF5591156.1 hypothetical protein FSUBG_10577 [Fusarium subglutinans]
MARHFVRSFVIAAALSPFVNAGPCRPSSSSVAVVTTISETSVATGSATTHTKESSLTESLSGASTETSVTVSESASATGTSTETSLTVSENESTTESASATSTETTLATSKTESGSTSAEQSTTTGSAIPTDITTTASESDSSTGTTLAATTSTECTEPEPPVYDDPFTHYTTEEAAATTSEAATTTEAVSIVPRNFIRRGHPEIFVRDATSDAAPDNSEDATTTTADATSTTEDATTTTGEATTSGEVTTSGEATSTGETTATSEDTTATTEGPTTTTEEATTTTEETTTASETATGCINNMERPTPEGAVCGSRGWVQGTSNDWRYLGEGPNTSVLDCYTACQQKSNCVTFLYEKNAQCSLYMGTVTQLSSDRTAVKTYETRCFCDTGIEPAPTCSYSDPFSNGGFEDGTLNPWVEDPNPGGYDPVYSKVVPGGEGGSSYHFQTGQFDFDKSLWLYQDIEACPGTTFTCSYSWWWNEYYAIRQNDGSHLVPYVHVYQGDTNLVGERWPTGKDQTKTWVPAEFTFTMPRSGSTRIWFVASSPQGEWINTSDDPCNPNWVHRPNWFALDSVSCRS